MKVQMHTFFVRLDVAGQLPTKIDAALADATKALNAGQLREAQRYVTIAHQATAQLGDALADLEAWGKAVPSSADTDAVPEEKPEKPPHLTEQERESRAEHPRLTGAALRAVLTGKHQNNKGQYWLPGIDDDQVARWYVNAYAPGQGGLYSNSTYSTVAQMADDELLRIRDKYPNPADWMSRELHNNANYIALQMRRTPTWADLLKMAGRE